jgi:hypothetical protein
MAEAPTTGTGRGPEQTFFADPALDRAMGVIMALATEVYVLRDRLRALENELAARGIVRKDALEAEPVPEALASAAADRAAFVAHLLEPLLDQAASKSLPPDAPYARSRLD